MREMNGKYVGNRPIKLRKSSWKDRQLEVVKKKTKEKRKLGYRVWYIQQPKKQLPLLRFWHLILIFENFQMSPQNEWETVASNPARGQVYGNLLKNN